MVSVSSAAPSLPASLASQAQFNACVAAHDFVVVLFTARWCAPCQTVDPVFAECASQHPQLRFATVDIDVATDLVANFQVKQVPALMVVRDRVVIDMVGGAMRTHELEHHLQMWQRLDMRAINAHFAAQTAQV